MSQFHLHLVSDATGETLKSVARAALVQFEQARDAEEHMWALVRSPMQMQEVLLSIEQNRGIVFFTLVDPELREALQQGCRVHRVPCISVLDHVIGALANFLGEKASGLPGRQHELDAEYFARIEAVNFTLAHDDGQQIADLDKADIVLTGVSRTSKTPTSIYLANRGMKTANVPIILGMPIPPELEQAKHPLIVGLIASPDRLVQVRRNRLLLLNEKGETPYVDPAAVKREMAQSRRLFSRHNWPVIDVSRRSIEETAAAILNFYARRQEEQTRGTSILTRTKP